MTVLALRAHDHTGGRNGGHIAPYTPTAFSNFSAPLEQGGAGLSVEEAIEVVYHEMENFRYAAEVIKREKWAVDLWEGERLEGRPFRADTNDGKLT